MQLLRPLFRRKPKQPAAAFRRAVQIEGLEYRRLLSTATYSDVTTLTASSAFLDGALSAGAITCLTNAGLTTSDNWRFVNATFNEQLTVPQFDTLGGTRVLTQVIVTGDLNLLQDFNYRVINNNGAPIDFSATGNASATFIGDGVNLSGSVMVDVPTTIIPGTPGSNDVTTTDHDCDPLNSTLTINPADAVFANFIGAGNVAFQLSGSATTDIDFNGLGNEVVSGGYTTIGRAAIEVTYVFGTPVAKISITPDDVNEVGQNHTFTVTVEQDDGLAVGEAGGDAYNGFGPAAGALVDVTLDGQNGAVPDVSSPTDLAAADPSVLNDLVADASGQVQVTFTSVIAGLVVGSATADVTFFGSIPSIQEMKTVSTDDTGDNSGPATKRFIDAYITIAPDATNPVNAPHTFTTTVWLNDGLNAGQGGDGVTGFARYEGAPVDVTLTNGGGAVANPAGPFTGNTDVNGEFDVTFTSATAGTVTGNASTSILIDGVTLARQTDASETVPGSGVFNSGPAVKTFEEQPGGEGLTPGFWKRNATFVSNVTGRTGEAWYDAGYSPYQKLNTVFTFPASLTSLGNRTLLYGLKLEGGGVNALIRHAVAAVLNAAHPDIDYPWTVGKIVTEVNAALASGDAKIIEDLKNELDAFNNLGGGVDQHGTPY